VVEALGGRELHEAVRPLVKAFWTYPETVHLLPDEARRRRVLPRYLLSDVRDAARFGTLLGAKVDGEIVGAAAWLPPEGYPVSPRRQLRQVVDLAPALPWGWRAAREAQRGQATNKAHHRRYPPHFYLRVVGVDPAAQTRGLGSSLVRPALDLADEGGVGCFLQTATRGNVSWYEQFGFEVAASYRPTRSWPDIWVMWRDPAPASPPRHDRDEGPGDRAAG
jgi:GNAT superfamily N-acetyltransferase